ncbi:MAG TPA: response regulator [Sphingobacteriaceae bacterium]
MNEIILVVEDNEDIRESIVDALELSDYKVYVAGNGRVALELVNSVRPNLILSDIMMPEVDGYALLKKLKETQSTANIPFIFMTANTSGSDKKMAHDLGTDAYLIKPFDDEMLVNTIRKYIH